MFPIIIINANDHIRVDFPTENGERLANYLIENDLVWKKITIDLQWVDAGTLISAFFNSFFRTLVEHDSSCVDFIGFIEWRTRFPFQEKSIEEWIDQLEK